MLKWLSPVDFEEAHRYHYSKRFGDTGRWFLNERRFKDWMLGTGSGLLWCYGIRMQPWTCLYPSANIIPQPVQERQYYCKTAIPKLLLSRARPNQRQTKEPVLWKASNTTSPGDLVGPGVRDTDSVPVRNLTLSYLAR